MPADVINSFISSLERMDLDHAVSHLTDECEYDNVPMGKVFGRDAVRSTLAPFLSGFDRLEWVVHQQVSSGNLDHGVVMNERLDRFGSGDRWLELPVAGLFIVEHGQISLWRDYFDRDTLVRQMTPA